MEEPGQQCGVLAGLRLQMQAGFFGRLGFPWINNYQLHTVGDGFLDDLCRVLPQAHF